MKTGGYILTIWGAFLVIVSIISFNAPPQYAEQIFSRFFMGIGLIIGGIYLINNSNKNKNNDNFENWSKRN